MRKEIKLVWIAAVIALVLVSGMFYVYHMLINAADTTYDISGSDNYQEVKKELSRLLAEDVDINCYIEQQSNLNCITHSSDNCVRDWFVGGSDARSN